MTDYDITRLQILLVDDNHHILSLFRNILTTFGCRDVITATDGAKGFKMLESFRADIALIDWEMEGMNGLEMTKAIRTSSDSPNPQLPIIMVSAYSEVERVERARDAGVNEFLAKPVSANSIYTRIKMLIDRPRPFVKSDDFMGPDRRRNAHGGYGGPERRGARPKKKKAKEPEQPKAADPTDGDDAPAPDAAESA